jgi:hypothetical protein
MIRRIMYQSINASTLACINLGSLKAKCSAGAGALKQQGH